ncbi:MAG TPA: protein kinase [Vicinamibacterales bacterium]|nr:protein kinase [Vicinamibacterales bacterium]
MGLEPGLRVGAYEIVRSLGAGGMGEVYQARDTRLGRLVAIKFVTEEFAADRTSSERLVREARLTSLLNHPNIITVHDVGDFEGRPFIVMEFVAGQSLHAALLHGRLKPQRATDIVSQVADGLAAAHAAGVVHRDLKPRNVMLTEDGRAKIVDFGIGKTNRPAPGADDPTVERGLTDTLAAAGTPGYMSPEQVAGRPIDFRTDQFALGAILYEMLTGRRAFRRDTSAQTMAAIIEAEPEPLAERAPDVPIQLVTIVERCLAKDPANRYASTQDLARDLRELRDVPTGSRSARAVFRSSTRQRWRRTAALLAVLAVIGAVALARWSRANAPLAQARVLLDRYDKQANVDQALVLLSPVVQASSSDPAAHTLLAEAYWRKFEYNLKDTTLADRAGEEAGLALTLNQSYAPAHVVLAMINYGQGRNDGALGEAQKATALDAKSSRAWRELGRVHFRQGRRDEAEKAFLTAVSLDPNDWTARNSLGSFYLNVSRPDEAIAQFERMQALAPDNTRAYNNLGTAFLQQERYDKATEMYERSLSLDKNATAYSNLGTALYQQGKYAEAARSFEGAVALPGATFVHWFNLGAACYWAPDLRGRAKEAYERAVALGEQTRASTRMDASALAELASSYAVLALLTDGPTAAEHRSRAHKLLDLVEQQQPGDAAVLSTLATISEELGDRTKALALLEQALRAGYPLKRIEQSPWLKELRSDDRYTRLRK